MGEERGGHKKSSRMRRHGQVKTKGEWNSIKGQGEEASKGARGERGEERRFGGHVGREARIAPKLG